MSDGLMALLFTALGVGAKSLWDQLLARRAERIKRSSEARLRYLEEQLSKFYWPFYTRLMRDNALWPHVEHRFGNDPDKARIAQKLEAEVTLPNHAAMVQILESNLHLAAGEPEVLDQVQRYIRHVAVYQAIRSAGIEDQDPIAHGEPWPGNLFPIIEARTLALQKEYNSLLEEARQLL